MSTWLAPQAAGVVRADHGCSCSLRRTPRPEVLDGRCPGGQVDRGLLPAADVLDLGGLVLGTREEDVRDAPALGVPDLLAELLGSGRDLAGDAVAAQLLGQGVAGGPVLLVDHGHQDRARHRPVGLDDALAQQRHEDPAHPQRDPDAGVRRTPVGGERVVAPTRTDRTQAVVAVEAGLEDGAGVVVEAPRDLQVGDDLHPVGHERRTALHHRGELGEAFVQQLVLYAESAHLLDERAVAGADPGERQTALRLFVGQAGVLDEHGPHLLLGHPVQLVDRPHRRIGVGDPEAGVEALDQLAVVDLQAEAGQADRSRVGEPTERVEHHPGHLHVVVEGEGVATDHVDVGLDELAEPALLRALTAPHLLDLVATEREVELAGVLQHVARERHRQVEVEAQRAARSGVVVLGVQPAKDVDLLGGLALAQELVQRLDGAGLDVGEAVQLEGPGQPLDDLLLDVPLGGQQLGEPAERGGCLHLTDLGRPGWCGPSRRRSGRAGTGWSPARARCWSAPRGRAARRCRRAG